MLLYWYGNLTLMPGIKPTIETFKSNVWIQLLHRNMKMEELTVWVSNEVFNYIKLLVLVRSTKC